MRFLALLALAHAAAACNLERYLDLPEHEGRRLGEANSLYSYSGKYGPRSWAGLFPACRGAEQSPINLPAINNMAASQDALEDKLGSLDVGYYAQKTSEAAAQVDPLMVSHNELTVSVSYQQHPSVLTTPHLNKLVGRVRDDYEGKSEEEEHGISQNGTWVLEQFHFHWGDKDGVGSEHTVDGAAYDLEVHFVHRNAKYDQLSTALLNKDGLLVVGRMFKVTEGKSNAELGRLLEAFDSQTDNFFVGDNLPILSDFDASKLLFDDNDVDELVASDAVDKYYTYPGSLTTPNCDETVTWVVMNSIGVVSSSQMDVFRSILTDRSDGEKITRNWRNVQGIRGRMVYNSEGGRQFTEGSVYEKLNSVAELAVIVLVYTTLCCFGTKRASLGCLSCRRKSHKPVDHSLTEAILKEEADQGSCCSLCFTGRSVEKV